MDKENFELEENNALDTENIDSTQYVPDSEAPEERKTDFPTEEFSFVPDGEDISYFLTEEQLFTEPMQVAIFDDVPTEEPALEPEADEDFAPEEASDENQPSEPAPLEIIPVKEKGAKTRRVDNLFDFLELFVFTLVAVLLVTTFLFRHSVVEGDSMMDTLYDRETVIISNLFYTPEYKDIVVVDDHSTLLKKPIVKRIIAVGGQTVRITKTEIFVDGELLTEEYVFIDEANYTYDIIPSSVLLENAEKLKLKYVRGSYYEITVPEGELFVMGDHRNKSTDSRVIGTVDEDAVLGRVVLRILPFAKFGTVD